MSDGQNTAAVEKATLALDRISRAHWQSVMKVKRRQPQNLVLTKPEKPARRLILCKAVGQSSRQRIWQLLKKRVGDSAVRQEALMILRAVILPGFLLLSNAAFEQHPSARAPAPQPPPPTLGLTLTVVPPGSVPRRTTQQQQQEQQREQQQRDERQREEQERQRQTPGYPANSSSAASPSVNSSVTSPIPATSQVSNGSFATSSKANAATEPDVPFRNPRNAGAEFDGRTNATGGDGKNATAKDQDLRLPAPDLLHKPCYKEPCKEPDPKPVPSDPHAKLCKVGPCPICAPGQSPGKDNSCVSPILAKKATAPPKTRAVPQACPADQIWNGIQCAPVGGQRCLPGQTGNGPSCQTDCTIATAGAQSYIELLRIARQAKEEACTRNSTQQGCQQAESTYNIRLNEYRTFLAGVSTTCTLPDPISN